MKTKDIVIGQDYLYQRAPRYPPRRVHVTAVGQTRQAGHGFSSTYAKDGVAFVLLNLDGTPCDRNYSSPCPPSHIRMLWSEWEPIARQKAEAARIAREAADAERAEFFAAVKEFRDLTGIKNTPVPPILSLRVNAIKTLNALLRNR